MSVWIITKYDHELEVDPYQLVAIAETHELAIAWIQKNVPGAVEYHNNTWRTGRNIPGLQEITDKEYRITEHELVKQLVPPASAALYPWLDSDDHSDQCTAHLEGQHCCLDKPEMLERVLHVLELAGVIKRIQV